MLETTGDYEFEETTNKLDAVVKNIENIDVLSEDNLPTIIMIALAVIIVIFIIYFIFDRRRLRQQEDLAMK